MVEEEENKGFENLKKYRGRNLDRIKREIFDLKSKDRFDLRSKKWFLRDSVRDSLCCEEVDNGDLWEKIDFCGYKNNVKCGSLWCKDCRDNVSRIYERKIRERIRYLDDELERNEEIIRVSNEDLYMLSGVVGVEKVNVDDINKSLKWDSNRWKRIKRRIDKKNRSVFIELSYEFELVNGYYLMNCDDGKERENYYKKELIRELVNNERGRIRLNDLFVFVHFHCVSNMNGEELKRLCGNVFYVNGKKLIKMSDCGLYVRKFISSKELDKNIRKVSNYSFKNVFRFKYSFRGSDYNNGEYLNKEELGKLISLYDGLKGRGYRKLFRSINNFKLVV